MNYKVILGLLLAAVAASHASPLMDSTSSQSPDAPTKLSLDEIKKLLLKSVKASAESGNGGGGDAGESPKPSFGSNKRPFNKQSLIKTTPPPEDEVAAAAPGSLHVEIPVVSGASTGTNKNEKPSADLIIPPGFRFPTEEEIVARIKETGIEDDKYKNEPVSTPTRFGGGDHDKRPHHRHFHVHRHFGKKNSTEPCDDKDHPHKLNKTAAASVPAKNLTDKATSLPIAGAEDDEKTDASSSTTATSATTTTTTTSSTTTTSTEAAPAASSSEDPPRFRRSVYGAGRTSYSKPSYSAPPPPASTPAPAQPCRDFEAEGCGEFMTEGRTSGDSYSAPAREVELQGYGEVAVEGRTLEYAAPAVAVVREVPSYSSGY